MKILLVLILSLVALTPNLVYAQNVTGDITASCNQYRCNCAWSVSQPVIQAYVTGREGAIPDIMTTKTPEECLSACVGVSGASTPEEEGQVSARFTCEVGAATVKPARKTVFPCLNTPIPGLAFGDCDENTGLDPDTDENLVQTTDGATTSNLLGTYVEAVYGYLLGAAAVVAATMLMIAGLQYATARGDSKQVDNAKRRIGNAVAGIILLLLAYNIAFIINPATTTFEALELRHIDPIQYVNNSGDVPQTINYPSIEPPTGVICDQTSDVYTIAQSLEGKVTYRLGAKGGPPPYNYETRKDDIGKQYASYCPEGQLCFDCSGYVGYVAHCAGLSSANESAGTRGIFVGAEKVTQCTNDSINGKALNPGDLIGWSATSGYGHVFIYVGKGKVSDASWGGSAPGRGVSMKDTVWACNSYIDQKAGLYVVRRPQ